MNFLLALQHNHGSLEAIGDWNKGERRCVVVGYVST